VDSPWQIPLPDEEYATSRAVVYFYNGGWIPITFYPLVDAIKLHRMGLSSGMDIVVFPANLDPRSTDILATEVESSLIGDAGLCINLEASCLHQKITT
jgi:hypothetical protein